MSKIVHPSFPDPYAELPDNRQHRTQIVIDKQLWSLINSCRGERGSLQITVNILLTKLHEQLELNGLTEFNPFGYERAVLGARITLGRATGSTEPPRDAKTPSGNVRYGVAGVVQPAQGRVNQPANPRSAPARGRTRKQVTPE